MPNTVKKLGSDDSPLLDPLRNALTAWPSIQAVIFVPQTEDEYDKAIEVLKVILDAGGADENHPLASLVDVIGTLISTYEDKHIHIDDAPPERILKHFMDEHGLSQKDLPDIGSQGVVSEILSGKRKLNIRQIQALAKRFNVNLAVFLPE